MTTVPLPYATKTQLAAYLAGSDYADEYADEQAAVRVLARASETIAWYTVGGYDDTVDVPATVVGALADATCAQVEQWCEIGEENAIAGWDRDTKLTLGFTVDQLPPDLAPRAGRILASEGILNGRGSVQVADPGDPIGVIAV